MASAAGELATALLAEGEAKEAQDLLVCLVSRSDEDDAAAVRAARLRRARDHVAKLEKKMRRKNEKEEKAERAAAKEERADGGGAKKKKKKKGSKKEKKARIRDGQMAPPPAEVLEPPSFTQTKLQENCIAILALQRANAELMEKIVEEEAAKQAAEDAEAERVAEVEAAARLEAVAAAAALERAASRGVRPPRAPDPVLQSIIARVDDLKDLIPSESRDLARLVRKNMRVPDAAALAAELADELQRRHEAIVASDGDEVLALLAAEARAVASALSASGMLQPREKSAIPEWRKGQQTRSEREAKNRPPSPPPKEGLGEAKFRLAQALDDSRRIAATRAAVDPLGALVGATTATFSLSVAAGGRSRDRFLRRSAGGAPTGASPARSPPPRPAVTAASRRGATAAAAGALKPKPFDASAFRTLRGAMRRGGSGDGVPAAMRPESAAASAAAAAAKIDLAAVATLLDEASLAPPRSRIATVTRANSQIAALKRALRYHPLASATRPGQADPARLRWTTGAAAGRRARPSIAEAAVNRQYQRLAQRLKGRRVDAVTAVTRLSELASRVHLECRLTAALVWCSDATEKCAAGLRREYGREELDHCPLDPLVLQLLRPGAAWSTQSARRVGVAKSGAAGLRPIGSQLLAAVAARAPGQRWTLARQAASDLAFVESAAATTVGMLREGGVDSAMRVLQQTLAELRQRALDAAVLAEQSCRLAAESAGAAAAAAAAGDPRRNPPPALDLAALERLRVDVEAHSRAEARRYIVQREMQLKKAEVVAAKMRYVRETTGAFTERAAIVAYERRKREDAQLNAEALELERAKPSEKRKTLDKARFFRLALEREQADRARATARAADPLGELAVGGPAAGRTARRQANHRGQVEAAALRPPREQYRRDFAPVGDVRSGAAIGTALDGLSTLASARFRPWAGGVDDDADATPSHSEADSDEDDLIAQLKRAALTNVEEVEGRFVASWGDVVPAADEDEGGNGAG